MVMRDFVGRARELELLRRLLRKRSSSLVVLKGRRRIGKSRLAREFSRHFEKAVFLSGLPPDPSATAQSQRDDFAIQLRDELDIDPPRSDDWLTLFRCLARSTSTGQVLVVLDEISWLGTLDPAFLGKLKTAWDLYLKKNPRLILILAGSMSSWIERNILGSTGFFGRVSLEIHLTELPLHECRLFWGSHDPLVSSQEKLRLLMVTGGVPRYLEEIDPTSPAEANLRSMCFTPEGLLYNEFDRIFSDLFKSRAATYRQLVECLAAGQATARKIVHSIGRKRSGTYNDYLDDLVRTGYLSRDYTWSIKTAKQSKLSRYRLADNYLRFYLKYIAPNRRRIASGVYHGPSAWPSIAGLQFENLMLNNRVWLHRALGIDGREVIYDNPYFRRATTRAPGCQVDYLIQTGFGTLYVCEAKFTRRELGTGIIQEVKDRIQRLRAPRGFSIRPVLIHVGGVNEALQESEFFASIIDFCQLLEPAPDMGAV